jgi:hypothetical protein
LREAVGFKANQVSEKDGLLRLLLIGLDVRAFRGHVVWAAASGRLGVFWRTLAHGDDDIPWSAVLPKLLREALAVGRLLPRGPKRPLVLHSLHEPIKRLDEPLRIRAETGVRHGYAVPPGERTELFRELGTLRNRGAFDKHGDDARLRV